MKIYINVTQHVYIFVLLYKGIRHVDLVTSNLTMYKEMNVVLDTLSPNNYKSIKVVYDVCGAITPRSTLTLIGNTCLIAIYATV